MAESTQDRTHQESTAEIEALRTELDRLKKDMAELIKGVKGVARSRVRSAKEDLEDGAERLSTRLRGALEHAVDSQPVTAIERQVSEHPATTLLAVFGLGWLLGRFVRR